MSQFLKTKSEINSWLNEHAIENYIINDDLTVDVNGNVDLSFECLEEIPVQFGKVKGNFDISDNDIYSLKGSPKKVKGHFLCAYCEIESIIHAPKKIGGNFDLRENELESLEECISVLNKIKIKGKVKTDFTINKINTY